MLEKTVEFADGVTIEGFPLEELGKGRFRIVELPNPFVDCFNYLDVVEMQKKKDGLLRFVRVLEPSRWQRFMFFVQNGSPDGPLRPVLDQVAEAQGKWVIDYEGILQVFLPPESNWDPTQEIEQLAKQSKKANIQAPTSGDRSS